VSTPTESGLTRREMITDTTKFAAVTALTGLATGGVFAAEDNAIRVALVGCGGRGTGAAENALLTTSGPIKLVAMADVFPERLSTSFKYLSSTRQPYAKQVEVPEDNKFNGFDAYKKAMDCLRKGDVVILATPPAFRWVHFTYAIEKGLNVFMEKPVTVDGPSTRRMLQLADESEKKGMKVGVGLMCRHCDARGELYTRLRDGQMGDILMLRAYRMAGRTAMEASPRRPDHISELMYQVKRFHSFLWASGGCFSDFLIHNIDECCWMKDAWPVRASSAGGRHYHLCKALNSDKQVEAIDQNFDSYSVEYTFGDGSKLMPEGRTIPGCHQEFASYAHGTKGSAIISTSGHAPSFASIYKGQQPGKKDEVAWEFGKEEPKPYQLEWDHLIESIRKDRKHNEVRRGAQASLVTAMGRKAAHTGQIITYEQMLKDEHELAPQVDKLNFESDAPVKADEDGKYPVPMPGQKKTEF
jgi:predicted dehydrogenase